MLDSIARELKPEGVLPLPQLPLASFIANLAKALPKLINFLVSPELRAHPLWSTAIPYHVPLYGTGVSRGHCIRPDVLLTTDGPKICELDFVPSGRGHLLMGLGPKQQAEVLQTFAEWYRRMGVSRVLYATATTTTCREETELFSAMLRESCGFDIRAGNIDVFPETELEGVFIDRLSYRCEMSIPRDLRGLDVATAEPFLDSKAIFAMVHDDGMRKTLTAALGEEALAFLRSVFPVTNMLSQLQKSEEELGRRANNRSNWVLKNSDVEMRDSWGSRGIVVGANYNEKQFLEALRGKWFLQRKNPGSNPVVQRWRGSRDFWQVWDGVINGAYQRTSLVQAGKSQDPKTFQLATKEVGARIGFYFLVVRESGECLVTPYGDLVLRQDRLIHGANDAIGLAVQAY